MPRSPLFLLLACLAACGAQPIPTMFGAARHEATVEGRQYVVFLKGDRAEVIRLGYARRGEHQKIRATMLDLVPQLTGCRWREASVQGDSGEIRGLVTCPKG